LANEDIMMLDKLSPSLSSNVSTSTVVAATITPEEIRSFSKAGPKKTITQHYKCRSTSILTDTPVKERLRKIAKERTLQVKEKALNNGKVSLYINRQNYAATCSKSFTFSLLCNSHWQ